MGGGGEKNAEKSRIWPKTMQIKTSWEGFKIFWEVKKLDLVENGFP